MPDRLGDLILVHWQRHHPVMLLQLQQQNLMECTLEETAERMTDILYDLVAVRKLEYHQAWELAVNEILLPEESTLTSIPSPSPPETSESPTPTESGWVASMRRRARISKPSEP
jgi:hypothetical protein